MVNMKNKKQNLKNVEPLTSDVIAKRLAEIDNKTPELGDVVRTYGALLPLLRDTDLHVAKVSLTQEQARNKLEDGLPLLHGIEIEFDQYAMADLLVSLVYVMERNGGPAAASGIRAAIEEERLDMLNVASLAAASKKDKIEETAIAENLDPEFLRTLTQLALKPVYYAVRSQVERLVEGVDWDGGTCPVCGAAATLGELQGNNQAKHLRCSRCGADWKVSRLQCHLCENDDHRTLGFLYTDEKPGNVRVDICDHCKGYLKVLTTFSPTAPELVALEDLATLHFDYAAQKAGYVSKVFPTA
jgi:formate dehydrogenase accessory protein FdhE